MTFNEIPFPDASGNTGYDKEAVQDYFRKVSDHIDEINATHQKELTQASSAVASGKDSLHQSTDILTNAHNVSKKYIEEAKKKATAILQDAEKKALDITAGSRASIDGLLKDAELNAHELTAKAETKATEIVEQAEKKAKNTTDQAATLAERLTTEASEKGQRLVAEASSFHNEASTKAAQMTAQAKEESERLLAAANTEASRVGEMSARGLEAARTKAGEILKQADEAYNAKLADADAALISTKAMIRDFIAYKHDGLERMKDFFIGQISQIDELKEDMPAVPETGQVPVVNAVDESELLEEEQVEEAIIEVGRIDTTEDEEDVDNDSAPISVAENNHEEYDITASQDIQE